MRDVDVGKRMAEEAVLEQVLESWPAMTERLVTEEWRDDFVQIEGSPDFIIGLDHKAVGVELAEIRFPEDAWDYYATASHIAWKKHESYMRRGMFANPIALILYCHTLPLFDFRHELAQLGCAEEFSPLGFSEVWVIDFSDEYYSAGHPFRRADMFCFKPQVGFGFHRIGDEGRKPYG